MRFLIDIKKNLRNIPGPRTDRKIVVLESDDWGSERAESKQTLDSLKKAGYAIEKCSMTSVDILESNSDLELLFEMLSGFKDKNGNPPVISAFFNVANPDFKKIKESGYLEYHYLNIEETAKKYHEHDRILNLYREGIQNRVFHAEYHGREHLQVGKWLKMLQAGQEDVRFGFELDFTGFSGSYAKGIGLRAAYDLIEMADLQFMLGAVKDGLDLFERTFGYRSNYFVAPNGLYPRFSDFAKVLQDSGVKFLGGASLQKVRDQNGKLEVKHFYLGKSNHLKQRYITRNGIFEPHSTNKDWLSSCLKDVRSAFRWNKPAIISTHRASYVGTLNPKNREMGLRGLKDLLHAILKEWPDVEFMNTKELTQLVENKFDKKQNG